MATGGRAAHERETLIFSGLEHAERFREKVLERLEKKNISGPAQTKKIVADAVAEEFESEGEAVGGLWYPWQHSAEEHAEVQQLVDIAFAQNLTTALRLARKSPHYPRNLDLFHDVLTGEMYHVVSAQGVNRQAPAYYIGMAVVIIVGALFLVGVLWLSS